MKRIISFTMACVIFIGAAVSPMQRNVVYASEDSTTIKEICEDVSADYVDLNEFLYGEGAKKSSSPIQRDPAQISNIQVQYNRATNELSFSAKIDTKDNAKSLKTTLKTVGTVYNREHVNYEMCYIADLESKVGGYTVIYMELFRDEVEGNDKMRFFIERNHDGEMYTATTVLPEGVLDEIDLVARNNLMDQDKSLALLALNSKSPNHSFKKDETIYVEEVEMEEFQEDSGPAKAATSTTFDAWLRMLRDQKNNSALKHSNYAVDQSMFTSLNTTLGQAQWKIYDGGFAFQVVRCAYYQSFSGTYTFYYAVLSSSTYSSTTKADMEFGFIKHPDKVQPESYSYRVELNKSTKTMRYVADYGLKFQPTVRMQLSSGSFTKAECLAKLDNYSVAGINLPTFIIGLYSPAVGTALSVMEWLFQFGAKVPTSNTSVRVWARSSTSEIKRDVMISLKNTSRYVYKGQDYLKLATTKTGGSCTFSWAYGYTV